MSTDYICLFVVTTELSCCITCYFHIRRFGEIGDVFLPKVVSVLLCECKTKWLAAAPYSYIYIPITFVLTSCPLTSQHYTGEPRGFSFVRFIKKDDAENALNDMNSKEFQGRELRIQFARQPRPNNPRQHFMERERQMGYGGGGGGGGYNRGYRGSGSGNDNRGYGGGGYRGEGGRHGGGYNEDRYDRGGGGHDRYAGRYNDDRHYDRGGRDSYDGGGKARYDERSYRGREGGRERTDDRHMTSR